MYFNYMYTTPSAVCLCNNIGLVPLILLGWELRVLYHSTMCTRHPDLVSYAFYAIPIFHLKFTCTHIYTQCTYAKYHIPPDPYTYRLTHGFRRYRGNISEVLITTARGRSPRAVVISTSDIFPLYRLKPCVNLFVARETPMKSLSCFAS